MGIEIKKCAVISGAPEDNLAYYNKYLNGRYIICADSGYKKCERAGFTPDLIIGDFDSSDFPDKNYNVITLNPRKDYTDTFHCVQEAAARGYNDIVILGGIGSRLDHTYNNLLCINYCRNRNINCFLVNRNNKVTIIDGEYSFYKDDYKYFSLYALFEKCSGVSIKGAEYELNNVELLPSDQLAQSNEFKDDAMVTVLVKKGKLFLFFSND